MLEVEVKTDTCSNKQRRRWQIEWLYVSTTNAVRTPVLLVGGKVVWGALLVGRSPSVLNARKGCGKALAGSGSIR